MWPAPPVFAPYSGVKIDGASASASLGGEWDAETRADIRGETVDKRLEELATSFAREARIVVRR